MNWRHVAVLIAAAVATAAPWTTYCALQYPREFSFEHAYVWAHVTSNVENWGGPWDRVLFYHMILLYQVFYTPMLVAALGLVSRAFSAREASLWLVYAWSLGVVAPLLMATTKTPSATLVALPALLLLLARLISEGWSGNRWPLALWTSITLVCLTVPGRLSVRVSGHRGPAVFAGEMRQSLWVVYHVAAAFAVAAVLLFWLRRTRGSAASRALRVVASVGTAVLVGQCVSASVLTVAKNPARPGCREMAEFVRARLPREAVLLFDGPNSGDHQELMMAADRPCYVLRDRKVEAVARCVLEHGGVPYLVSASPQPRPPLYRTTSGGRAIYAWSARGPATHEGQKL